jgi:hypothetical protein
MIIKEKEPQIDRNRELEMGGVYPRPTQGVEQHVVYCHREVRLSGEIGWIIGRTE